MTESWDEVMDSLSGAYGLVAWGATVHKHSILTVELGKAGETDEGSRYCLSIRGSTWRLDKAGAVLAGTADEGDDLAQQVATLNGHVLAKVMVEPRSWSARFAFDGGLSLNTFTVHTHDTEHWSLRRPDGTELIAGPGSGWSIAEGDRGARDSG